MRLSENLMTLGRQVPLASPKAVLGDLCEAGGVIGLILALNAISKSQLPPTFNYRRGDENSARLALANQAQPLTKRRGLVTARNFLGLCAAMVVSAA